MSVLLMILIVGAFVYLLLGGREGLADRISELAKWMFVVALLVLLMK